MALQTSGAISINDIATEFGGSTPHSLSEYYGAAAGIPTSGAISISDFYGASSITTPVYVSSYIKNWGGSSTTQAITANNGSLIVTITTMASSGNYTAAYLSGGTQVLSQATSGSWDSAIRVYYKVATGNETLSFAGGQTSNSAHIFVFDNMNTSSPVDVTAQEGGKDGSYTHPPAITPSNPDYLIVQAGCISGDANFGSTEGVYDYSSGYNYWQKGLYYSSSPDISSGVGVRNDGAVSSYPRQSWYASGTGYGTQCYAACSFSLKTA